MTRLVLILAAATTLVGCQSAGRLPGIDPTDYAYLHYKCDVTQVYPEGVPQVRSAAVEAMGDLGYTDVQCEPKAGLVTIRALTLDGRPARVTIQPRNSMAAMTVKIGAVGDEMVSQTLIQRVALNLGALPRTIIPLERTLSRRFDPLAVRPDRPIRVDPISPRERGESLSPMVPRTPLPFSPPGSIPPEPPPADAGDLAPFGILP
jgi:hypothetical protein